jgi:hypothetical protein
MTPVNFELEAFDPGVDGQHGAGVEQPQRLRPAKVVIARRDEARPIKQARTARLFDSISS